MGDSGRGKIRIVLFAAIHVVLGAHIIIACIAPSWFSLAGVAFTAYVCWEMWSVLLAVGAD